MMKIVFYADDHLSVHTGGSGSMIGRHGCCSDIRRCNDRLSQYPSEFLIHQQRIEGEVPAAPL